MINEAVLVAVAHHATQVDKQGQPYLMHLVRVAGRCQDEIEMVVAILHDTVEDTDLTLAEIRGLFGDEVAEAVDHLTKRDGEPYDEFIERAKQNPLAARIKTRDVVDHLRRETEAIPLGLRNRYRLAYRSLTGLQWDKTKHLPDG